MSFAAAEVRLGRATAARLGNCTASFNGGLPVRGTFDNSAATAPLGAAGAYARQPRIACASADVAHVQIGQAVVIDHHAAIAPFYTVSARLPDELHTGMCTLLLEPAQ